MFPLQMMLTLGMSSGGAANLLGERVMVAYRRAFIIVQRSYLTYLRSHMEDSDTLRNWTRIVGR